MKNQKNKLMPGRTTVRSLTQQQLGAVVGGDDIIVIGGVIPPDPI